MAHRNRWFTYVYLAQEWWIFPWQTVSHNQMAISMTQQMFWANHFSIGAFSADRWRKWKRCRWTVCAPPARGIPTCPRALRRERGASGGETWAISGSPFPWQKSWDLKWDAEHYIRIIIRYIMMYCSNNGMCQQLKYWWDVLLADMWDGVCHGVCPLKSQNGVSFQ